MTGLVIAILTLVEPAPAGPLTSQLPNALRAAFASRERLQTGWIEYAETDFRRQQKPIYRTAEFTATETLTSLYGDENGYIGDEFRPERPYRTLNAPAGTYQHDGGFLFGVVGPPEFGREYSPRSFGLFWAVSASGLGELASELTRKDRNLKFEERRDGDLIVVTRQDGDYRTVWWLDPRRDFNPVRVRSESDRGLVGEVRITLDKFDDVWFPREIAAYRADAAGDEAPVQILSVTAASFNQPTQAKALTPADAGFEPGLLLDVWPPQTTGPQIIWDGEKPVPDTEFLERIRAGQIKRGARNRAAHDALPPVPPEMMEAAQRGLRPDETGQGALRGRVGRWRQYTEEFILRFALDEDQRQRARQILADCENRGSDYLTRNHERFADATRDLEEARRAGARDERLRIRERLNDLLAPLDRIFDDVLKPRLERLPTRAQRDAADAAQKRRAAEARGAAWPANQSASPGPRTP